MAEVKWIKLTTDMFDNRKIKHLRRLPDGNSIVLIWVMLLTMAGRCNANGMIFLTENIPYTPKMLADELDFEENTVKPALKALEDFNMIVTDGDRLVIAGWEEYQNIEGMEKIKEQTRKRVAKYRENKKRALIGVAKKCVYCGGDGDTVDHVVAKTKGGLDIPQNTVCCCLHCNMQKNDHDVVKFLNDRLLLKEPVDVEGILTNSVLQQHVRFDYVNQRFVTLHVTQCNATEKEIDKEKEKDIEKDNKKIIKAAAHPSQPSTPKKAKKDKPEKNRRGEFQHVLLTDDEEDKLFDEYGMEFALKAITFLDEYIEENKDTKSEYKKKNHYLCIKRWVIDAVKEKEEKAIKKGEAPKVRYGDFDVNEAFNLAMERSYGPTAAEDDSVREKMEALKQRLS